MSYQQSDLTREQIDLISEALILQFGTDWCGYCQRAEPIIEKGLSALPIRRIKIEDGPGRKLARSFKIKLWPTLLFLKSGTEIDRIVRPENMLEIRQAAEKLLA